MRPLETIPAYSHSLAYEVNHSLKEASKSAQEGTKTVLPPGLLKAYTLGQILFGSSASAPAPSLLDRTLPGSTENMFYNTLSRIENGILGFPHPVKGTERVGISMLADRGLVNAFFNFLQTEDEELHGLLAANLARMKLKLINLNNLRNSRTIEPLSWSLNTEAYAFIGTVKELVEKSDEFFTQKFPGETHWSEAINSEEATMLFHRFVAETAPSMFALGFPEAAEHGDLVSRFSVVLAANREGDGLEPYHLLRARMYGWAHDFMKMDSAFSSDNMVTHPLMVTAAVRQILNHRNMKSLIQNYLEATQAGINPEVFMKGFEGLMNNGDSYFVLKCAVDKLAKSGLDGKALLGEIDNRYWALSKADKVKHPIPESLLTEMDDLSMGTGIWGIEKEPINQFIKAYNIQSSPNVPISPEMLINKILGGETPPLYLYNKRLHTFDQFKSTLIPAFRYLVNQSEEIQVPGPMLFMDSLVDPRKNGQLEAIAQGDADRMSLTFPKILEAVPPPLTTIQLANQYYPSFKTGADGVRFEDQELAQQFYRQVLKLDIATAAELNGSSVKLSSVSSMDPEALHQALTEGSTWGEFADKTRPDRDRLVNLLRTNYNEMLETFWAEHLDSQE